MPEKIKRYESWGRYPPAKHSGIVMMKGSGDILPFASYRKPVLAFGQGRSYGDTCLNDGGVLIDTQNLSSIVAFDDERGILRCEAGTTLSEILELIVPRGWFLPVTPGTKHVSVGGAIAHDVHGKNHHRAGTFGCHVKQFELLRSSGERLICSPSENADLYRATIAGMGLTGLILWAEFQLKPIAGPLIATERLPFTSLEEFFSLAASSDNSYEYTVGWLDSRPGSLKLGQGIFTRGNHAETANTSGNIAGRTRVASVRRVFFDAPGFLFNQFTVGMLNAIYSRLQFLRPASGLVDFEPFFYPLDAIEDWNRIYGRRGFFQYQCVVPHEAREAIAEILSRTANSGLTAVLAVLKTFGDMESPGMLSFPRPGVTLALDFPNSGDKTLQFLEDLDAITRNAQGAVYPAKDARMSARSFQSYFPEWKSFAGFIDPKFSSSFWRRVAG
ncbi:MAG: FAD-binding oxidoreductase [Pyrinomonadaceae bacterium]